jgi:hypothetical protein
MKKTGIETLNNSCRYYSFSVIEAPWKRERLRAGLRIRIRRQIGSGFRDFVDLGARKLGGKMSFLVIFFSLQ